MTFHQKIDLLYCHKSRLLNLPLPLLSPNSPPLNIHMQLTEIFDAPYDWTIKHTQKTDEYDFFTAAGTPYEIWFTDRGFGMVSVGFDFNPETRTEMRHIIASGPAKVLRVLATLVAAMRYYKQQHPKTKQFHFFIDKTGEERSTGNKLETLYNKMMTKIGWPEGWKMVEKYIPGDPDPHYIINAPPTFTGKRT